MKDIVWPLHYVKKWFHKIDRVGMNCKIIPTLRLVKSIHQGVKLLGFKKLGNLTGWDKKNKSLLEFKDKIKNWKQQCCPSRLYYKVYLQHLGFIQCNKQYGDLKFSAMVFFGVKYSDTYLMYIIKHMCTVKLCFESDKASFLSIVL